MGMALRDAALAAVCVLLYRNFRIHDPSNLLVNQVAARAAAQEPVEEEPEEPVEEVSTNEE